MSRQLRIEFPGAIHHVTSRGNERRNIYRDERDRRRFLEILEEVVILRRWVLHAWVLMSNHYHLLIETPEVGLSRGMKKLNETYAKWFNTRHRRVGHLFQGPFQNILVERESHLLELTRYIVLNPVRCGAVNYAGDWKWSNYRATAGLKPAPSWLQTDWTLAKFDPWDRAQAREDYRGFVAEARGSEYKPWESLIGRIYLGGEAFCEMVQKIIDSQPRSRRAYPRAQVELVRPTFEHVIELVLEEFSESLASIRCRNHRHGRKALALLAYEDCGLTHRMIAEYLMISQPAVSQMLEKARALQRKDQKFSRAVEAVRKLIF
ncbi:MAG: transposase [Acidobacteria bacterium]|nr:transposase [Acidobacteriota bacterium]